MQQPASSRRNWKALIPIAVLLLLVGGLGAVLRFGVAGEGNTQPVPRVQQAQTSVARRSTYAGPTPTLDCTGGVAWRVVGSPNLAEAAVPGEEGEGLERCHDGPVLMLDHGVRS